MSDTEAEVRDDYRQEDRDDRGERESDRSRESVQTTTVVTRSKDEGLRNELRVRMRNSTWTLSGWKACVVETVSLGLMVAGAIFVGMHGREVASSIGSSVSGLVRR